MIAAQPGAVAHIVTDDGDRELFPVVAWDDDGYALIPDDIGRLVRAWDVDGFDKLALPNKVMKKVVAKRAALATA